jgi:hypothetical protein
MEAVRRIGRGGGENSRWWAWGRGVGGASASVPVRPSLGPAARHHTSPSTPPDAHFLFCIFLLFRFSPASIFSPFLPGRHFMQTFRTVCFRFGRSCDYVAHIFTSSTLASSDARWSLSTDQVHVIFTVENEIGHRFYSSS